MRRLKSISLAVTLSALMAVPAYAGPSKKYQKGMDELSAKLRMDEAQKSCVSEHFYDNLGKKQAKAFVRFANVFTENREVPEEMKPTNQQLVDYLDRLGSAFVGLTMIEKGFTLENLKYARAVGDAKKEIAEKCGEAFPGADMTILLPDSDESDGAK